MKQQFSLLGAISIDMTPDELGPSCSVELDNGPVIRPETYNLSIHLRGPRVLLGRGGYRIAYVPVMQSPSARSSQEIYGGAQSSRPPRDRWL